MYISVRPSLRDFRETRETRNRSPRAERESIEPVDERDRRKRRLCSCKAATVELSGPHPVQRIVSAVYGSRLRVLNRRVRAKLCRVEIVGQCAAADKNHRRPLIDADHLRARLAHRTVFGATQRTPAIFTGFHTTICHCRRPQQRRPHRLLARIEARELPRQLPVVARKWAVDTALQYAARQTP